MFSSIKTTERGGANRRLIGVLLLVFALLNVGLWAGSRAYELAQHPIDLQSSTIYQLRRQTLQQQPSALRVVMLGDSFVYGGHLRDTLGSQWHLHTLPAQLSKRLRRTTGKPITVTNFGLNGGLFADYAAIVKNLQPLAPALFIVALNLRPLSEDFNQADQPLSRAFLHHPTLSPLCKMLPVCFYREAWQMWLLDDWPLARLQNTVAAALKSSPPADQEDDLMATMHQQIASARRYASIDVTPRHPQMIALDRLISTVHQSDTTRLLLFYFQENTKAFGLSFDQTAYNRQRSRFTSLIYHMVETHTPGNPPADRGKPAHFLPIPTNAIGVEAHIDHIHLSPAGYADIAELLTGPAAAMLKLQEEHADAG